MYTRQCNRRGIDADHQSSFVWHAAWHLGDLNGWIRFLQQVWSMVLPLNFPIMNKDNSRNVIPIDFWG